MSKTTSNSNVVLNLAQKIAAKVASRVAISAKSGSSYAAQAADHAAKAKAAFSKTVTFLGLLGTEIAEEMLPGDASKVVSSKDGLTREMITCPICSSFHGNPDGEGKRSTPEARRLNLARTLLFAYEDGSIFAMSSSCFFYWVLNSDVLAMHITNLPDVFSHGQVRQGYNAYRNSEQQKAKGHSLKEWAAVVKSGLAAHTALLAAKPETK